MININQQNFYAIFATRRLKSLKFGTFRKYVGNPDHYDASRQNPRPIRKLCGRGPQEPWGEQKGDLSGVAFANEHRANFAICRAGNEVGAAFAKSKERTPPALFSLDLLQVKEKTEIEASSHQLLARVLGHDVFI